MRLVVLQENISATVLVLEAAVDFAGQVEFLSKPKRHGGPERPEPLRGKGQVRLQQSVELQQRLVVESHEVELLRADPPFL